MAHLLLSVDGQRSSYVAMHRLADRIAGGRWVALGGGGYEVGRRRAPGLGPPGRRGDAADRSTRRPRRPTPIGPSSRTSWGATPPGRMTDGRDPWGAPFERNYHPEDPLDAAIMDPRRAVFPLWGLVADPFGAF